MKEKKRRKRHAIPNSQVVCDSSDSDSLGFWACLLQLALSTVQYSTLPFAMEETLTTILEEEEEEQEITDQPMPDVPQNPNSHPSDSESDSDSEDESQQKVELQTLETELSSNPSNYDSHVQYIRLLRKMGEIEKLRQAREAMSLLFPLTPSMWQDWAKDEASLVTTQYHPHPLAFCFCVFWSILFA